MLMQVFWAGSEPAQNACSSMGTQCVMEARTRTIPVPRVSCELHHVNTSARNVFSCAAISPSTALCKRGVPGRCYLYTQHDGLDRIPT